MQRELTGNQIVFDTVKEAVLADGKPVTRVVHDSKGAGLRLVTLRQDADNDDKSVSHYELLLNLMGYLCLCLFFFCFFFIFCNLSCYLFVIR